MIDSICIVIPALNPDEKTTRYIGALIENEGFGSILVVNDGSGPAYDVVFQALDAHPEVTVLNHPENKGKGAALKTAFRYVLENMPACTGVVTADADGQHSPQDTKTTADALAEHPNHLVLGMRDFHGEHVPWTNKTGNRITTAVFALFYGKRVHDTQTGLRGYGRDLMQACLNLAGDRYEFEMHVLMEAAKRNMPILSVPIKTIYLDDNASSHYNKWRDSFRIYTLLLKPFLFFALVGVLSAALDIFIFTRIYHRVFTQLPLARRVLFSTIGARVLSGCFNFTANRLAVFHEGSKTSVPKYVLLACVQLLCSWALVTAFKMSTDLAVHWVKVIVEAVLFVISFQIQRRWVFRKK